MLSFTLINVHCTVNTKVNYMEVLLDITFIFTLLDFAKRSLMVDRDKSNIEVIPSQPKRKQQQQQQTTDGTTMKLDVVLNEPRIALLEDASRSNSRAIVIQVGCEMVTRSFNLHMLPFRVIYN